MRNKGVAVSEVNRLPTNTSTGSNVAAVYVIFTQVLNEFAYTNEFKTTIYVNQS